MASKPGQCQTKAPMEIIAGGMKILRTEDGNLQLAMDVSQFKPEEVRVRICDDSLVVEAKTESYYDHTYPEFKHWLKLFQDVKQEATRSLSTLAADKDLFE